MSDQRPKLPEESNPYSSPAAPAASNWVRHSCLSIFLCILAVPATLFAFCCSCTLTVAGTLDSINELVSMGLALTIGAGAAALTVFGFVKMIKLAKYVPDDQRK